MDISNINDNLLNYLNHVNENNEIEFECVLSDFDFSKEDFNKILKFCNNNYKLIPSLDRESLDISVSNDRLTISGKKNIIEYCKNKILQIDKIIRIEKDSEYKPIKTLYDVKFKLKKEIEIEKDEEYLKDFKSKDKYFRYKQRYSFLTNSESWRIDCTIVKSSKKNSTNIINSGVLKATDKFEVEIEYIPNKLSVEDNIQELKEILTDLLNLINDTKYLINNNDKTLVIINYLQLVNNKLYNELKKNIFDYVKTTVKSNPKKYFLSYQPITLERNNLIKSDIGVTNILEDYTVTEKADGDRALLYVNSDGKMYLLDSKLNVRYMGTNHKYTDSLLDGEYIKNSKFNTELNKFMCFDVYFINKKDVRGKPLVDDRINLMNDFVDKHTNQEIFSIGVKDFKYDENIFELSNEVYNNNEYEYDIDGLIFTPKYLSVGELYKNTRNKTDTFGGTWTKVFKWKPPKENTIDMLVKFLTNENDQMIVQLQVGNNSNSSNYINPLNVFNNTVLNTNKYIPVDFDKTRLDIIDGHPRTKMNEIIYNNYIVEFYYDKKWVPYRIRHDKTKLYHISKDINGTANSMKTALNVWRTIQNPVTNEMMFGEETIEIDEDDEIYYAREINRFDSLLKNMTFYHNRGVKERLFRLFKNKSYKLLELACGKGGDLHKWIEASFNLVVGVDYSIDNILNSEDGVYARYNKAVSRNITTITKHPMIFYQHDLTKQWDESNISNDNLALMRDVVWGKTNKTDLKEDKSILKNFMNVMNDKFNVVSCQFAIHYFFENDQTLDIFCDNLNKVIKKGGYFIGTTLDGGLVKRMLREENNIEKFKQGVIEWNNGEVIAKINDNVVWMVKEKNIKKEDGIGLGQEITVYIETINREYNEYLVDFDILEDKLKERDIILVNKEELKELGLTSSSGSFEMFYDDYVKNYQFNQMSQIQKKFSYLNKWFIFKKI
jgi:hypothetical protein